MSEMSTESGSNPSYRDPPTTVPGRLRYLGPSLILTAMLVGSGELIVTTTLGARVGFVALWIIIGTCIVKVALQEAIGRYTICSGHTTLQALSKLPGPKLVLGWAGWFLLFVVAVTLLQLGAMASIVGGAINILLPQCSPRIWAMVICLIAFVLLISGKYEAVERTSVVMVTLFSISIIISAIMVQWTEYAVSWKQIGSGFTFNLPKEGWALALSVLGIVGLSATEILFYPYWCLEKGYAAFTGPKEDSEAWRVRAAGWIKVMHLDCYLALVIYTITTIAFYVLGAAILHPRGEVPQKVDVIVKLSAIFTETFGLWAFYIFVLGSIIVLFSTLFVSIASHSRLMTDYMGVFNKRVITEKTLRIKWTRIFIGLFAFLFASSSFISTYVTENLVFLIVVGTWGVALLLPMVCFLVLYLRYYGLEGTIKPRIGQDIWLWGSAAVTVILTIYTVVQLIHKSF